MDKKKTAFTFAGAGFAAALLAGCLGTGSQDSAGSAQETQSALLGLAVKDSGSCKVLHARCKVALAEGDDPAALVDSLIDDCIIDTARAHRILDGGMGKGGHGGRGHGGPHGIPRLDSAARKALCDSLTEVLATADTAAPGYAELKRHAAHACFEPPAPLDPAGRAALCDSLKTTLAAADTASSDYPHLAHMTARVCEDRRPPEGHGRGPGRHGGPHLRR